MLEPGQHIAKSLKLIRVLGEGGMGRVWVAHHNTLEIEVAVKFLNRELAQDQAWFERFRREAQSIAKIDSAHVVRVFDHGVTDDDDPFIVMELLRGEDLGKRIERLQRLPLDDVTLILTQACRALGRVHELGIVHRDVKPENIFLTQEGSELFVKMLDFGIAKRASGKDLAVTDARTMIGTPHYMSPEQVMSAHHVDHRTDLWALAVVTYQMLTGQRPFDGGTVGAIHVQINAAAYRPVTALRPDLPAALDDWFAQALHRQVDRRFDSARAFNEAFCSAIGIPSSSLRQLVATPANARLPHGESIRTAVATAKTISRPPRPSRWLTFAGLGVVLAAGIGAWGWQLAREGSHQRLVPTSSPSLVRPIERTVGPEAGSPAPYADPGQTPEKRAASAPSASASAVPAAHLPAGTVKGARASRASTTLPSLPPTASARPLKDRGF